MNASNAISNSIGRLLQVSVICEIKQFSVVTMPDISIDGWLHLQKDMHMSIEFKEIVGTFADYFFL